MLRTAEGEMNNDDYYEVTMPSRIMQNMSGVKHVNMPAKLLSPCPKTLPGDAFGWSQDSPAPGTAWLVGRARLIREARVSTITGTPPGKTAAMDIRYLCILLLQQKDFLPWLLLEFTSESKL